jgi:hypothetical protein
MLLSWRATSTVAQKTTLVIGAGACRGPLDARRGAKSIGLFAIKRKCDQKTACCAVVLSKPDSRISIVLFRGKSEGQANDCHEQTHGTEQGAFSDCFDKTCLRAAIKIDFKGSKPILLPSPANTARFS